MQDERALSTFMVAMEKRPVTKPADMKRFVVATSVKRGTFCKVMGGARCPMPLTGKDRAHGLTADYTNNPMRGHRTYK